MTHSNISIFIPHKGCPNCCSFCNQRTISSTEEPPDAAAVAKILADACPKLKEPLGTEIAFFGGSFTAVERNYMISLLEAAQPFLKEYGLKGIRISTRPDKIDTEILGILKEYNVTAIELGAQSMRDEVLAMNDRGHTSDDIRKASALIKESGFELGLQMMTGLYGASPSDDICTAGEIIKLSPETVRIYPTVILGGTKLADLYQSGVYKTVPFEEEAELCAQLMQMFEENGIRVIRLGLHASEGVEEQAVGGYYHPAMREICLGICFKKAIEGSLGEKGSYKVFVHPKAVSMAVGQKKCNIEYFKNRGFDIKICADKSIQELYEIRTEQIIN
ncbi:MAG: elongator complex protein 3 [Oscillospiraceae bacterium]